MQAPLLASAPRSRAHRRQEERARAGRAGAQAGKGARSPQRKRRFCLTTCGRDWTCDIKAIFKRKSLKGGSSTQRGEHMGARLTSLYVCKTNSLKASLILI